MPTTVPPPRPPRMKMGLTAATTSAPVRDYSPAEIRRDGWGKGAVAFMHRILDDCLERGIDVSLTEHYQLNEMWEASAACRSERNAGVVTPKRRAWFAMMAAEHVARRAAEAGR